MRPPRPFFSIPLMLLAVSLLASTAPGQVAARAVEESPTAAMEREMALLVDRARVENGLLPLARAASLDHAATAHALDMAAQGYMEHEAPDGSVPASRAADAGYHTPPGSAWLVVEVISARGDPPEHAVNWWLSDGLHRRVVLRPTWREMGIGFAPGGPYGRFWVVLFGCRPNVLPPVLLDGVLNIPDETCSVGANTFGRVDAIRINDAEWQPYASQVPWENADSPRVHLRDANGRVLLTRASDPTVPTVEAP